jgi:hypothetical protein
MVHTVIEDETQTAFTGAAYTGSTSLFVIRRPGKSLHPKNHQGTRSNGGHAAVSREFCSEVFTGRRHVCIRCPTVFRQIMKYRQALSLLRFCFFADGV